MVATPKQLKDRWLTPKGKEVRQQIIDHIREDNWERFLEGFPFVKEVENSKDLRFIDLSRNNKLGRAKLNEANLSYAKFNNSNLTEAELNNSIAIKADFYEAKMYKSKINGAILKGAKLIGTTMLDAEIIGSNLDGALLWGTMLQSAYIDNSTFNNKTSLDGAKLYGVSAKQTSFVNSNLNRADFSNANLSGAIFNNSNLTHTSFNEADISNAHIINCCVYGISAWDIKTNNSTKTENLNISKDCKGSLTIDDIEIPQFIYLILNNKKISNLITTMRTKSVLILGSFNDKSKSVLDRLKKILANKNLIPIIFDFKPSEKQDLMETVRTLALLSNFVIVDLSIPAGQLHELASIVRDTYIPFVTIANKDSKQTNMLNEFRHQYWFKSNYFKYSLKDYQKQIPILINNEIFPWVEKINKKLREERTGI